MYSCFTNSEFVLPSGYDFTKFTFVITKKSFIILKTNLSEKSSYKERSDVNELFE